MKKKNIFKEMIIALLLCLVILLVLALVLYNYVPSRKTLPEKVAYAMPQEVSQELVSSEGVDDSQVVMTYEVGASDIQTYENINDYNPGRANPFELLADPGDEASGGSASSSMGGSGSSSSSSSNGGAPSSGSSSVPNSGSSSSNGGSNNGGTDSSGGAGGSGVEGNAGGSSSSSPFYNDHGAGK